MMNALVLTTNDKYKKELSQFLKKSKIRHAISDDITNFKVEMLNKEPKLFLIQADANSKLEILHLVRDIRKIFGMICTIINFGDNISQSKFSDFLANGADQFFS